MIKLFNILTAELNAFNVLMTLWVVYHVTMSETCHNGQFLQCGTASKQNFIHMMRSVVAVGVVVVPLWLLLSWECRERVCVCIWGRECIRERVCVWDWERENVCEGERGKQIIFPFPISSETPFDENWKTFIYSKIASIILQEHFERIKRLFIEQQLST